MFFARADKEKARGKEGGGRRIDVRSGAFRWRRE